MAYINPHSFCNKGRKNLGERNLLAQFIVLCKYLAASVRVWCSFFSLLFPLFSRLPNTPLEDDNSRDAWLSLFSLKRREARLVVGQLQVVLMC